MNPISGEITIQRPPEDVFNFVTTFGTWSRWFPITRSVSGAVDEPSEPGQQCTEHVRLRGVPLKFFWTTKEKDFPNRFVFQGHSNAGGQATITYQFAAVEGGTRFKRELVYVQTHFLMKILDWLFIRREVRRVSNQALDNLKKLLEA